MTTPTPAYFASTIVSRDAIAVLVLIESSAMMHGLWENARTYYLPLLLDALRSSNPARPMRVCWQTTTGSPSDGSGTITTPSNNIHSSNEVPLISFDASPMSSMNGASLRHAVDTLRVAFPQSRQPSRHLIVVAANTPSQDFSGTQAVHSIAFSLVQNDIRLHMVLSSGPQVQPLRELHQRTLHLQHSPAITPWFDIDASRYQILLSGDPAPSPASRPLAPPIVPSNSMPSRSPPRPEALHTMSISSPLPSSSLVDTPVQETLLAAIPRHPKGKQKVPSPPAQSSDPPRLGLVNYLQQMHGLTKKRTSGSKSSKRASAASATPSTTGESSRSGTVRPILPRLDLTSSKPHGRTPYPKVTTSPSELERSPPHRAASQKDASSSNTPPPGPSSEGQRANQSRRLPWILPAPLPASSSGQAAHSPSAAAALESLAAMTQRQSDPSTRMTAADPSHSHDTRMGDSASRPGSYFPQRSLGRGAVPAHPGLSHLSHGAVPSHSYSPRSGVSDTPADAPSSVRGHYNPVWTASQFHEHASHSYSPHSHIPTGSPRYDVMTPVHDPGDQPFIITPEYEAHADAEYAEALRSGALEAQMTSATLPPTADSPHTLGYSTTTTYFPNPTTLHGPVSPSAVHSTTSMMGQPQTTMQMPMSQGYFHYETQGPAYGSQDAPRSAEHEHSIHASSSSAPSSSHHRHHDSPPYDSSADRWYGT